MTELSTEERRLLLIRLMVRALDEYERGDIRLAQLVSDVKSLVNTLFEVADSAWVEELRTAWGRFEIVYACLLPYEGRAPLTDEDHADIARGVQELRVLLAGRSSDGEACA